MKFLYLVRRDEEWHKNFNYSFILGNFLQSKKMASYWDEVFNITWIDFRKELNKIREENEKKLKFDKILNTYEVKNIKQLENYIVVPCDDDDWLHDNIFDILKESFDENINYYRWNATELSEGEIRVTSYPTNIPYPNWKLDYNYLSNNYAIKSPKEFKLVDLHGYANKKINIKEEKFIKKTLSIHNGSLASLTFIKRIHKWFNGDTKNGLLYFYEKFKEYPFSNTEIPKCFLRYIDMMMEIYRKKLKPKKVFKNLI